MGYNTSFAMPAGLNGVLYLKWCRNDFLLPPSKQQTTHAENFTMTTSLSKQIVVVLGAGPGIGFSVARKFSALGHPVALLARSLDKLEELAGQLNANDKGGRAKAYAVDATDEQGLRSTVAQVEKDFSSGSVGEAHRGARIHTGVFNPNGGMSRKPFLELTTADIKEAYQIQV